VTDGATDQDREVGGMTYRATAWLAWALCGLSVAMFLASVALYVLAR
jgi:hypothetical protein